MMNRRLSILVLFTSMAANAAVGQPSERAQDLIDQLDSEHWLDRDLATRELVNFTDEFSLEELEYFLSDMTLSLEQRARLMQACVQRFRDHPKGGLGVSFGTTLVGAIEVVPIKNNPNFPASEMLNPGDAIASIGGVMLTSSFDLRAHILSREPGETLPAAVIRNNKLIEMDLPLGSFTQLTGAARLDPPLAKRALELRWARKGIQIDQPQTIGSTISIDQWMQTAFPTEIPTDVQAPARSMTAAIIAGVHRLISVGQYNPRRVGTWTSPEYLEKEMYKNDIRIAQSALRNQKAQRDHHMLWRDLTIQKLEAETDPTKAQALESTLDILNAQIDALEIEITDLEARNPRITNTSP